MGISKFTIGLDIGSNSLGWAIVDGSPEFNGENIIAGVRVFSGGTAKTQAGEQSRNSDRRAARQARRQNDRYSRRKRKLKKVLITAGMYPCEPKEQESLIEIDPYFLRRKGLYEKLTPEEFGRALLHLNQRRGFRSSLKIQDQAKEEGEIKKNISALSQEIAQNDFKTIGELFAWKKEQGMKIRGQHTSRQMFIDEFELLWNAQAQFFPDLLTEALKNEVYSAIFYQRPLKEQSHLIGKCKLEPEERRCPRSSWYAQQFRILQEINNFRVLSRSGERTLTEEERKQIFQKLMTQKSPVKIQTIKSKLLDLDEIETLNFEATGRDSLEPNYVEAGLQKIFGKDHYLANAEWYRNEVWEALIREDPYDFKQKAENDWGMNEERIKSLFDIKRPSGYTNYSLKAIKKLLPWLEKGFSVYEAIEKAGYQQEGQKELSYLPPIRSDEFRNPIVVRALSETRKVINAIIRNYGMPEKIMIEMARQTKGTIRSRQKQLWENLRRAKYHEEIREKLQEKDIDASRNNITKYKLWEECNYTCPFTGSSISFSQLFGNDYEYDIEHIFPFRRSLDDSFINKTLCKRSENISRKGNRTPYEAYYGTEQYDQILLRVNKNKKMPYAKRKRFSMKEIPEDFTKRQLVDTSYAAKSAVEYLKQLGCEVDTVRGHITSELRHFWGLNSILNDEDDNNQKSRDDHRHHAIDAIVVAHITKKHINALKSKYDFQKNKHFPSPWDAFGIGIDDFRRDVKKSVQTINVSHRPERKISGKMNLETNYGKTGQDNQFVYRVPLQALTPAKVTKIVDPVVRAIVESRLKEFGIEPGKGSKPIKAAVFKEELRMKAKCNKEGPPIKKVRVRASFSNAIPIKDKNGIPYRYVEPGSNHHIAIYEYEDEKGVKRRCKEMVSRFEAYQRRMKGLPIVNKKHPQYPDARFMMSLCINDMVIYKKNNNKYLCRVQKISGEGNGESIDISFRDHTASTIDSEKKGFRVRTLSPSKFDIEKVFVDPLGRVLPAHD
jgi:CRISPR-associated endonuclease Csn1